LEKQFDEVELERLLKQSGVGGRRELDQKLRSLGTSLETQRRTYCQRYLAHMWLEQHVKPSEEVNHDQMLRYYHDHQAEFTKPARASWEELMVDFAKYPNEDAAYAAICRLGNAVLAGTQFGGVARAGSDGVTAAQGGQRNWTSQGSLVCKEIDQALFSLPIGKLSPVIKSANGFHIVRVMDREDAAVTTFLQAQVEIKDKIIQQRTKKQTQDYMAEITAKTPVWTIFDDKPGVPQMANPPRGEIRR
jgi:hypothetical protein